MIAGGGDNLMFKLLMSWNIRPGYEDEYFEFIVQEFGPAPAENFSCSGPIGGKKTGVAA